MKLSLNDLDIIQIIILYIIDEVLLGIGGLLEKLTIHLVI